jgi:hypothetical protein
MMIPNRYDTHTITHTYVHDHGIHAQGATKKGKEEESGKDEESEKAKTKKAAKGTIVFGVTHLQGGRHFFSPKGKVTADSKRALAMCASLDASEGAPFDYEFQWGFCENIKDCVFPNWTELHEKHGDGSTDEVLKYLKKWLEDVQLLQSCEVSPKAKTELDTYDRELGFHIADLEKWQKDKPEAKRVASKVIIMR